MNNPLLQEASKDVIHFPMEKKKEKRKRDRLLIELPEGGRAVWKEARIAAYRRGVPMGAMIVEILRKELSLPSPARSK